MTLLNRKVQAKISSTSSSLCISLNRLTFLFVAAKIFDDTYLFTHPRVAKRSTSQAHDVHKEVASHKLVHWAEQQKVLSRQKRQFWRMPKPELPPPDHYEDTAHLDDERWGRMWYLNRGNRLDMNVQDAWVTEKITGKGISITILDDGVERSHPDLIANYDPMASYDVNDNDNDPTPRYDMIDSNRHGKNIILTVTNVFSFSTICTCQLHNLSSHH